MKKYLPQRLLLMTFAVPLVVLHGQAAQAQTWPTDSTFSKTSTNIRNSANMGTVIVSDSFTNATNDISNQSLLLRGSLAVKGTGVFHNIKGNVIIQGDLILDTDATFINDGAVYVFGNVINNSDMSDSLLRGKGSIYLMGSGTSVSIANRSSITASMNPTQTISGAYPFVTYDLFINNNAAAASGNADNQVILAQSLTVLHQATFMKGIVTTPNGALNPMIFGKDATVLSAADGSHVKGIVRTMATGQFTYPVGDGVHYQKLTAGITGNPAGLDATYKPEDAGNNTFANTGSDTALLETYFTEEYWDVNPVAASGTTAKLTVFWDDVNQPVIGDIADLRVARKDGSNWVSEGDAQTVAGNTTTGAITSANLNTFGAITLGSVNKNQTPLPVTLVDFTAVKKGDRDALVSWNVAQELDLKGYAVERSSANQQFKEIGYVAAANQKSYQYPDMDIPGSKVFYRLRMEDRNNTTTYSKIVMLTMGHNATAFNVYPNPVTNNFTISFNAAVTGVNIRLYNIAGQLVYSLNETLPSGKNDITIARPFQCVAGSYKLQVVNTATNEVHTTSLTFR